MGSGRREAYWEFWGEVVGERGIEVTLGRWREVGSGVSSRWGGAGGSRLCNGTRGCWGAGLAAAGWGTEPVGAGWESPTAWCPGTHAQRWGPQPFPPSRPQVPITPRPVAKFALGWRLPHRILPALLPPPPPPDMRSGKHGTAGPCRGGIAVPRSSSPWVVSFLEAGAVGEAVGERGIEEGSRGEEGSEVRGFGWQMERPRLGGRERGFPR